MKVCYLIILLTFIGCADRRSKEDADICGISSFYQPVERVSFDDIDKIKKLNGKFIRIEGYFYADVEDVALYPKKSSNSTEHALWLNLRIPDSLIDRMAKKKVWVVGRVNLSTRGHLGAYFATLDSTFCIREASN